MNGKVKTYYCIVRGAKSKINSLQEIFKEIKPTVRILNDTFMEGQEVDRINGIKESKIEIYMAPIKT